MNGELDRIQRSIGFSGLEDWMKSLNWVGVGIGITGAILIFAYLYQKKGKK